MMGPFVGLRPFESSESLLFFGREKQVLELMQRLHLHHFVMVTGSSGCGKSSLIRAGLIPRLHAGFLLNNRDEWKVLIMKPGESPLRNLTKVLLSFEQGHPVNTDEKETALLYEIQEQGLEPILAQLKSKLNSNSALFLLVDQFEEIFRFSMGLRGSEGYDESVDFVNLLLQLARQTHLPVYIALTMRSDFTGDCTRFYGLPEMLNQSQYIVPRLTRIQLRMAIEGPVKLFEMRIQPGLTERVLNDAQNMEDELPLLQHVMLRIWDREKNVHRNGELDIEDYLNIGGIEHALSVHADEALQSMQEDEKRIAEKIFRALTSVDDNNRKIRRPARLSELENLTGQSRERIMAIMSRFIDEKRNFLILNQIRGSDDILIDISHESLIRQWNQLNDWVNKESESARIYKLLKSSFEAFQKKEGDLLTGNELQLIRQWIETNRPDEVWASRYSLSFTNHLQYLHDSEAEEKKIRFRKLLNRRLMMASVVAIAIITGIFSVILYRNNRADRKELMLNYWERSQYARKDGRYLETLHYLAAATSYNDKKNIHDELLLDASFFQPPATLKAIFPLPSDILCMDISPDSRFIISGMADGSLRMLSFPDGKQVYSDMKQDSVINSVQFNREGNLILSAGNDNNAVIWNSANGKKMAAFTHDSPVYKAVFGPGSKYIFTACFDSTIRLWMTESADTGKIVMNLPARPLDMQFSRDHKYLIVICEDKSVQVYDGMDFTLKYFFRNPDKVSSAISGPDNNMFYTANQFSGLILRNLSDGKILDSVLFHLPVRQVSLNSSGDMIAIAADHNVFLVNTKTGYPVSPELKHSANVLSVVFSSNNKFLITGGRDKMIRIWNVLPSLSLPVPARIKYNGIITASAFSNDGKWLIAAGTDSVIHLWNRVSGKPENFTMRHAAEINSAGFSPDSKFIYSIGNDNALKLWDLENKSLYYTKWFPPGSVHALFSSDGKQLITSSSDGFIRLCDIKTIKTGRANDSFAISRNFDAGGQPGEVQSLAINPDNRKLLLAMGNEGILFDILSGLEQYRVFHDERISDVLFSTGGNYFLTAGYDQKVKRWDIGTGTQTGAALFHENGVGKISSYAGSSHFVSGGFDGKLLLWNIETLKQIGLPVNFTGQIRSASFSPDGRFISVASDTDTLSFVDLYADTDMPSGLFELQTKVITGVEYQTLTNETVVISPEKWAALHAEYVSSGQSHFRRCRFRELNLWNRLNQAEKKQ